jgi:nucleoside-diphosphate-sugar epimerase
MKNIFVTGGGGYVGCELVQRLLGVGHKVTCVDTFWFGNYLDDHQHLKIIRSDYRDCLHEVMGHDIVVHLANIANDPAVDLDPALSWEINVLGARLLADAVKKFQVPHLIYASSGSVYGIQDADRVTEDLDLKPISVYNKTKMCAEAIFMSYASDSLKIHLLRPATVCGLSKRMRLDVAVNMLTFQALKNGVITVLGGDQTRPNVHIDDMVGAYQFFIDNPSIMSGAFNVGFENVSILELAKNISKRTGAEIRIEASNDPRSYRQDSSKLLSMGFKPNKSIEQAIDEIVSAYGNGHLKDDPYWYTVKTMKKVVMYGAG